MTTRRIIILTVLSCILCATHLGAQQEESIWFFGGDRESSRAGIRFTEDGVEDYSDIRFPLDLQENNIIVTDPASGELIFYSNGQSIVDRGHTPMPDRGRSLNGGPSNVYGTVVIADPADCERYIIIYGDDETNSPPRRVYSSTVDLSLTGNGTDENPRGEILAEGFNSLVTSASIDAAEGLFALPKNNGTRESWLFIGGRAQNNLYVYDVTASGITLVETISFLEIFPDDFGSRNAPILGIRALFRPTGGEEGNLIIALVKNDPRQTDAPVGYLSFNRVTGAFADRKAVIITSEDTPWTYGLTLSPNGDLLYLSDYSDQTLRQYEFATGTLRLLGTSPHVGRTGGVKLGPDGRVYWANRYADFRNTTTYSLARVNNPNVVGEGADLEYDAVSFSSGARLLGALPRFASLPTPPRAEQMSAAKCGQANGRATVDPGAGVTPFSYVWDSGETEYLATTLSPGLRFVTVTDNAGCVRVASVRIEDDDDELAVPTIDMSGTTCTGGTVTLTTDAEIAEGVENFWVSPTGETIPGSSLVITDLEVTDSGTYEFVTSTEYCGERRANIALAVIERPRLQGSDTTLCSPFNNLSLIADEDVLIWNDPIVEQSESIAESGTYYFERVNVGGCVAQDSIRVTIVDIPDDPLPDVLEVKTCTPVEIAPAIQLDTNAYRYEWSSPQVDGLCLSCPSLIFTPDSSATIKLTVTDRQNGCVAEDSVRIDFREALPMTQPLSAAACDRPNGRAEILTQSGISPFTYLWDSGENQAIATNLAPGVRFVTVTDANNCESISSVVIEDRGRELDLPVVELVGDPCMGKTVTLVAAGPGAGSTENLWSAPSNSLIPGDSLLLVNLSELDEGAYELISRLEGCEDQRVSFNLKVSSSPEALALDTTLCTTMSNFSAIAGEDEIVWKDSTVTADGAISRSGVYSYLRTNSLGCSVDDSTRATIIAPPVVELPTDLIAEGCNPLPVYPNSEFSPDLYRLTWSSPSLPNLCTDCPTATLIIDQPTTLQLSVTDQRTGCIGIDSTKIGFRANYDVYIPNAFSPNNDGINDRFILGVKDEESIVVSFRVYDTWGDLVFKSEGLPVKDDAHGWDGRGKGDVYFGPSVFAYTVKIAFSDGQIAEYAGYINLVR